jgi:hypothetical protein
MAENAHTARATAWNTTYNQLLNLTAKLEKCQLHERDALERAIAAQEEHLLDTPAASLDAVRVKLEILFDGQMTGLDAESEARRLVVEDVHNIATDFDELIGFKTTPQPQV